MIACDFADKYYYVMTIEESIRDAWKIAKPLIAEAVKYGEYTIEMIEAKVISQEWMIWLSGTGKSAWITEIFENDLGRCLTIPYVGGEMDELLENYDMIERMARDLGCVKLYLMGRAGWFRVFQDRGFKQEHIIGKRL